MTCCLLQAAYDFLLTIYHIPHTTYDFDFDFGFEFDDDFDEDDDDYYTWYGVYNEDDGTTVVCCCNCNKSSPPVPNNCHKLSNCKLK